MRRLFVSLTILLTFIGASLGMMSPAGAAMAPCPVGDGGWYLYGTSQVHQCIIGDNQMVIRAYNSAGQDLGVVFQSWLPQNIVQPVFLFVNGHFASFRLCPVQGSGYNMTTGVQSYIPGWETVLEHRVEGTQTFHGNGVVNHWKGHPDKPYSTVMNNVACAYGTGVRF